MTPLADAEQKEVADMPCAGCAEKATGTIPVALHQELTYLREEIGWLRSRQAESLEPGGMPTFAKVALVIWVLVIVGVTLQVLEDREKPKGPRSVK